MRRRHLLPLLALVLAPLTGARAQPVGATSPATPDVPPTFTVAQANADYDRREVMIPMRDGKKLHTVIVVPRGAKRAPIILTRTPYNASKRAERAASASMAAALPPGDDQLAAAGYIRVFQDIRGKFGSEGDYIMTRPVRGPLNPSEVDHATDAYDTIEWLIHNVPETNGKVGMIGSSYEGFTVLMALVHPHPALLAAVPMCPMVDGWRGDDWFHNGAFRQTNLDYIIGQTSETGEGKHVERPGYDDYENFRRAGSTGDYARANGFDQLPFWKKVSEHPAYDAFWQGQALDHILGAQALTVPTMFVDATWDQEDSYGGPATYAAVHARSPANAFFVLGPWRHSGMNYDGSTLGPLKFDSDTALAFRRDVMQPFLAAHLEDHPAHAERVGATGGTVTPAAFVFETGTDVWRRLPRWPLACASGCPSPMRALYLQPNFGVGFEAPIGAASAGANDYLSDPAKPVPYVPRPVRFDDGDAWRRWLVSDQRAFADRPDVLTYTGAPLTKAVHIAGAPTASLFASTTGTDADWIVKLIDVYPDNVAAQPELGGYELPIAMDIFRGRYRDSLSAPTAIPANQVEHYAFALPTVDHVFLPGHRIMVQIQSSWFPLYDRNPQTFVPNIFFARAADYVKATQRVYYGGKTATAIELPVVP